jgi:pyridoxamine 5'-phosphate oxidase
MPDTTAADPLVTSDPIALFEAWLAEAWRTEPNDANAMSVASVGADGRPSVRIVLLKSVDARGFVFFTNFESRKGVELLGNPLAALNFHWKTLRRQVRIEGPVTHVSPAEADAYHLTRARESQVGAWASDQSRPLDTRTTFERKLLDIEERYAGRPVPRPPHWSGFRVAPERMEFWMDRPNRLHDRLVYTSTDAGWETVRLYP